MKTHNGNSLARSPAKTQILASEYYAPWEGTICGGAVKSILAKATYKRSLVYLAVPERKQTIKTNGVMSKGLKTN